MSKRKIACALLAFFCTAGIHRPHPGGAPWTRQELGTLARAIDAQLRDPVLRTAHVGLRIVDATRGTPVYSRNAREAFMPASNMKLLTGSAALARLGDSFAFQTTVDADAQPQNGAVHGNLYLRGGGDAQMTARDLDGAAAALAALGITQVDGSLIADASRYDGAPYGAGWLWDDLRYYYAAPVSALELEEGVIHVTLVPSPTVGAPVTLHVWPQTSAFTIDNRIITGMPQSKDTTDIARPLGATNTIELTGSYPQSAPISDDLAPSVPDANAYAADVFLRALNAHGITVAHGSAQGIEPANTVTLWMHRSAPMTHLLADMWIPSDNLMAELFLKELGVAQNGTPGTAANGVIAETEYLQSIGVNPQHASIWDGSGLSAYDRLTPLDLVAILQADWSVRYRDAVLDALPIAGVRGTLKHAYTGTSAEGAVFAKTGTWTHATALSGYVETRTHGAVTFSFLIDEWLGDDSAAAQARLTGIRGAILSEIASQ